ncbi:MAG: ATP-binding protein [Spirochaetaceae bacterium]|jgi:hypothetical protein|nr:ATP-binding protein [Spirochaetaceae bacterium]
MKKAFRTNGRLLSQVFSSYNTTFDALCELINNSIQANAKKIMIEIDLVSLDDASPYACTEYRIIDDGDGISSSEFGQKILEIATDVKPGGKGIGRFAAFQIGSTVSVETTAYDIQLKKYINTALTLNANSLLTKDLSSYEVDIATTELEEKTDTFYRVSIKDFWNEVETENNPRKTFISKLLPGKLEEALFLKYSTLIITDKITFFINDIKIEKDSFLVDNPKTDSFDFKFSDNTTSNIALEYIHYKGKNKNIILSYRVDNNGIKLSGFEDLIGLDYPDDNSWLVHIDSDKFTPKSDIFRNLPFEGMDTDLARLKNEVRSTVREFIKEKHKDYFAFRQTLLDDHYYPYRNTPTPGSKEIAFNQLAYFIEKDYSILQKKEPIRRVIYPLLDKAISNSDNDDLEDILKTITALDNDQVKKFRELLKNVALSEVIRFTNDIYKKEQFLDFLHQIIYGEISKYLLERNQLHKIIERNLWIFGEEYTSTPSLFSDTQLAKNLKALYDKHFKFQENKDDINYYDNITDKEILDITDLFFYNERLMNNSQREIIIVELKAPRVKISQRELNQVERYMYDIERLDKFSGSLKYKIILVSSGFSAMGESLIVRNDNSTLYHKSNKKDIEIHVMRWSDIIAGNRRRLSYLGNQLKTRDVSVREIFEKDYPELDTTNLTITTKKVKK